MAVEMTGGGKRGKLQSGFPLFPPPLEIAARFPHSHRIDDEVPLARHEPRTPNYRKEPLLGLGHPGVAFRLILQLEYAAGACERRLKPAPHYFFVEREATMRSIMP